MLSGLSGGSVLGPALLGSGGSSVLQMATFLLSSNKQEAKRSREGREEERQWLFLYHVAVAGLKLAV